MHRRCPVSMWSRAAGTMASAFVPKTITQAALPEICQKLRYAQPHAAPRSHPRQHVSPARMWEREVVHCDVNRPHINGMQGVRSFCLPASE